jgi:penicillin-binding protein 1A
MAHKMGVVSPLHSYAAEALGGLTEGVTPLEMANVFATLADGGWRNTPIAIKKVVFPDGHVDNNWGQPHRVKVLSEAVTAAETNILRQNVQSGTATKSAINCPTAAKTGTTSELVDAWLDGYTPNYSTVVWMGYPNTRVSMTSVHGQPQQGGYLPADIWHAYMSSVTEGKPCVSFRAPPEAISYKPFYGNYATTGRGESGGSGESGRNSESGPGAEPREFPGSEPPAPSNPRRGGGRSHGNREGAGPRPGRGGPPREAPAGTPPPAAPKPPPARETPSPAGGARGH